MSVIRVENLCKDYRQHFWTPLRRVLHSVSFDVKAGEIFGFLGPNGSGKSTTIKILLEIVFASSGKAWIFDQPVGHRDSKRRIGFLPENPYFHEYLTSKDFLEFHGSLLGLDHSNLQKRIPEVLELVGMNGTEMMQLRSFSKGMLQRIGLAQAILHDPDLVILDEPMTGLDPVGRKEVRDLMLLLKSKGKTVFFSTHILSDVETICDRVAIMNKGSLLQCGTLEELLNVNIKYVDLNWTQCPPQLMDYFDQLGTQFSKRVSDSVYLKIGPLEGETSEKFQNRVNELVRKGLELGGQIELLSPKKESLEDVFVRQVGKLESRV